MICWKICFVQVSSEETGEFLNSILSEVWRIHGFTISFPVLILPVFRQLLLRTEKFRVYLCFETSMQTADDNSKVTSQAPLVTSVLYIFKLVLYFNSSIISNQIKHYLAIKGRNFLQIHMAFTGMLCRFTISYHGLLLKEHVPRTQGS